MLLQDRISELVLKLQMTLNMCNHSSILTLQNVCKNMRKCGQTSFSTLQTPSQKSCHILPFLAIKNNITAKSNRLVKQQRQHLKSCQNLSSSFAGAALIDLPEPHRNQLSQSCKQSIYLI